ncbi:MAG: hypothetical protein QOJ16_4977 [Acidobacteriota bacterium]|jgi:hypothetical protein|nr:hypothetical protein [Acidobacteriota bacterium]
MMNRTSKLRSSALWALALLVSSSLAAVVAPQLHDSSSGLAGLAFQSERLAPSQPLAPLEEHLSSVKAAVNDGWTAFRLGAPAEWKGWVDRRTGRIAFAEGGNIAWIPGRGNSLTPSDLPLVSKRGGKVDMAALEAVARGYLPKVAGLLGVDTASLVLNRGRSGQPANHLWLVDFDVVVDGQAVEGARVVFRVNNGNLVQMGTENLPAPGAVAPKTTLTREQALAAVARHIGGWSSADVFLDAGSLHLLPVNVVDPRSGEGFAFGRGRGLARVWQLTFQRDGVVGTWRARVDAATGEVLELADINQYAQATGGIYPRSPADGEVVRAMPYADLSTGGFANSAGLFSGGPLTSTLAGQYVRIVDGCGAISLATNALGNLAFGTSGGTDCTTPGIGGAGNTHAAREQFYQVNRIKEVGRGWLPGNTWLGQQLTANVNQTGSCNAYWQPANRTLNFLKSSSTCANAGEISGLALHEFGHGLDQMDGTGTSSDSGEAYADVTAMLALHDSCIGTGFFQSGTCTGYGDACTACTGARDLDYAKHTANIPATADNYIRTNCPLAGPPAPGACGKDQHCESYVPGEALWDFANRDLPGAGDANAWIVLERLWYLSRNTATAAFVCHTGSGSTYTSDGCSIGSWWTAMRLIDDDDGNLGNGTPHGGALFAAFNRHGIACAADSGASVTFAGCSAPAAPVLSATVGDNSATLSWTGAGATYDLFKNEVGCNAAFAKIASGVSATSVVDGAVANGTTYYYQVTAYPSGNAACSSPPSTCLAVTPTLGPPTALTATAASTSLVNVTWTAPAGATGYELQRSSDGGAFQTIATQAGTSYPDGGRVAGKTYVYRVRATNASWTSAWSVPDIATTFFFTDDPVSFRGRVRKLHVTELRQAVNLVRAAAGLGAYPFTDANPTRIRTLHVAELRTALGAARSQLGLPALSYTDPVLTPGVTRVRVAHVQEVRQGTR